MFKNYLTYNLALSFHRSCLVLEITSAKIKERLMRSSETMIHQFAAFVHTRDPKDESKYLFVSLQCLRDCKESLDEAGVRANPILLQYEVLHARTEQLLLKASEKEQGQLRMLG